ncbi:MAG: hypothetical protein MUE68_11335 [Bacteroidetes bacterium]|jgi:hypothetical protein|nr:hypothetical protein [Bacteroidota bacterium]
MSTFRYKLDFHYQQTLLYLVTLVLYAGIRGSFMEGTFTFFFHDPIVVVILFFFATALGTLLLNLWRARHVNVGPDRIVFHARHRERVVMLDDIEWIHIGRERLVQTAGRFQQVLIKTKGRRWAYRIRIGRYEREQELVAEIERLATKVPSRPMKRYRAQ